MENKRNDGSRIKNISLYLKNSKIKFLAILIGVGLITSIGLMVISKNLPQNDNNEPDTSYQFPYTADLANGEVFNFSAYSGKVVVLEFMTTSCGYCMLMGLNFQALYDDVEERFFEIIKIDIGGSSDEALLSYMESNGFTFNIARDNNMFFSSKFVMFGTPTTVVLYKNGTVYTQFSGMRTIGQLYNTFTTAYNA